MSTTSSQKRVYASNAILYSLFVVGVIVLVNLIGTRFFGRIDLTESKVYTLSQASKDLVKTLPDTLSVKAFISTDLPPEMKTLSRYVRDLIDEYRTSSNGKFRWEAVEPNADKEHEKDLEQEANRCKVEKIQIQVLRGSKFEMGSYYFGLCFQYGDKIESIPQVSRAEGLEFEMSSLIKKMTVKKRKIAFTTGHGESDTSQGFRALKQVLEQEYDMTTVNPSSAEIGADVDALVIGGPKQAIDDKGQREIDRFLMTGKGAIILADGMAVSSPGGQFNQPQMAQIKMVQGNQTGLDTMLAAYGFKIGQDVIADNEAAMPGLIDMGGGRRGLTQLPIWVGVQIAKNPPISALEGIRGMVFPLASSVELVGPLAGGAVPAGGKVWNLASSGASSWKHTGFFIINQATKIEESKDHGPFAFAYAYQGPLKSAFVKGPEAGVSTTEKLPLSQSQKPVRLVVVGDSDFANDDYVQLSRAFPVYEGGALMLHNAIGWTVEDEALIPLRSKSMGTRPMQPVSEAKASTLKWVNILGLPMLFCAYGVVRWRLRRIARSTQTI
jgi:gliding-associated putative ABC transporter substrate-binding component GldG